MNRDSESQLIGFCVAQHRDFEAEAWGQFSAVTRTELAATARYLAGVEWYGHETQLKDVADRLSPWGFAELARESKFDAPRFSGLLRAHLRQAGRVTAA